MVAHSKKRVNRAGALWRDWLTLLQEDPGKAGEADLKGLNEAATIIEWWRSQHARPLIRVNANVRYYLREAQSGKRPRVTQRLKRFATIVNKLQREPTMKLSTMGDIGGSRAILDKQDRIYKVVHRLQSNWEIKETRDYIDEPKPDGYRAVHLIIRKNERLIELQLRTPWQDLWAQSVERDTRRLRLGLKFGVGPSELRDYYVLVSQFFALREVGREPDDALYERLRELYDKVRPYFAPSGVTE